MMDNRSYLQGGPDSVIDSTHGGSSAQPELIQESSCQSDVSTVNTAQPEVGRNCSDHTDLMRKHNDHLFLDISHSRESGGEGKCEKFIGQNSMVTGFSPSVSFVSFQGKGAVVSEIEQATTTSVHIHNQGTEHCAVGQPGFVTGDGIENNSVMVSNETAGKERNEQSETVVLYNKNQSVSSEKMKKSDLPSEDGMQNTSSNCVVEQKVQYDTETKSLDYLCVQNSVLRAIGNNSEECKFENETNRPHCMERSCDQMPLPPKSSVLSATGLVPSVEIKPTKSCQKGKDNHRSPDQLYIKTELVNQSEIVEDEEESINDGNSVSNNKAGMQVRNCKRGQPKSSSAQVRIKEEPECILEEEEQKKLVLGEDRLEETPQTKIVIKLKKPKPKNAKPKKAPSKRGRKAAPKPVLWECSRCSAMFRTQQSRDKHLKDDHLFRCIICQEEFEYKVMFEVHMAVMHVAGTIKCLECRHVCMNNEAFKVHYEEKHMKKDTNLLPAGEEDANTNVSGAKEVEEEEDEKEGDRDTEPEKVEDEDEDGDVEELEYDSDWSEHQATNKKTKKVSGKKNLSTSQSGRKERTKVLPVCTQCGKTFQNNNKLIRHMNYHLGVKKYSCAHCGKGFVEKGSLVKHEESHFNKNIPCEKCGKAFKHERTLKKHLELHLDIKRSCKVCGKVYKSVVGLNSHLAIHMPGGSVHKCPICSKDCRSRDYLRMHMKHRHLEGGSRSYSCPDCGKSFKWEQTLKGHMALKHHVSNGKTKEIVICPVCGDRFLNKHVLKAHMPKHEMDRPYACKICGMNFKYKHSRDKHLEVVHSNKREHQCPHCGKMFKTKTYLDMHVSSVHLATDPVKCSYCEKHFKTAKILHNHIQLCHTLERTRKHFCSFCGRNFIAPKDLLRHEKVHTGVKDHFCTVCGKAFSRKDNLQTHMKVHQGVKSDAMDSRILQQEARQETISIREVHIYPYPYSKEDDILPRQTHEVEGEEAPQMHQIAQMQRPSPVDYTTQTAMAVEKSSPQLLVHPSKIYEEDLRNDRASLSNVNSVQSVKIPGEEMRVNRTPLPNIISRTTSMVVHPQMYQTVGMHQVPTHTLPQ